MVSYQCNFVNLHDSSPRMSRPHAQNIERPKRNQEQDNPEGDSNSIAPIICIPLSSRSNFQRFDVNIAPSFLALSVHQKSAFREIWKNQKRSGCLAVGTYTFLCIQSHFKILDSLHQLQNCTVPCSHEVSARGCAATCCSPQTYPIVAFNFRSVSRGLS